MSKRKLWEVWKENYYWKAQFPEGTACFLTKEEALETIRKARFLEKTKTFVVHCRWGMTGNYIIKARTEDEARRHALALPLPAGGYLPDTFKIYDIEEQ